MINQYLDTMIKGLESKKIILNDLYELSEKQRLVVSEEDINWDEFDKLVDIKADKVEELEKIDNGFDAVYNRVREDINFDKNKYKDYIVSIQKLISDVTEKSTSLMALEQRNKAIIESSFSNSKKQIGQNKKTSAVAANYYKSMSRINYIDPQLMDSKK